MQKEPNIDKMDNLEIEQENNDKANVVPLRLITGGKGPPGANWLSSLTVNTVFLCRRRDPTHIDLAQYHILHKTEHGVLLFSNLNDEVHVWVDPNRFCKAMELVEVIHVGTTEDE